ncbi:MAG: alpha/beta hydrolase [Alphaproteobacteria bacterium]|nr:alpha/beta hydrolase [Alphaproteobacteria bacterium]
MIEETVGPTSHSYFSQRLRLHYVDWGNAGAPPLLLVHGGRDHCRNWDWVAQRMRGDYHILAPDLRGHGDSQWMLGGSYNLPEFVYDIAQLLHQTELTPTPIVAHSLGGMISLLYAGLYPEKVEKLVVIEGLGLSPERTGEVAKQPTADRMAEWVDELRTISGRAPKRYPTLEEAYRRMQEANPHLSPEQARHLTVHGVNRNEDGTYSWKFDNYVRQSTPYGLSPSRTRELWSRITCPVLLLRGTESWASDPAQDGRAENFQNVRVVNIEGAGHWLHHDQLETFLDLVGEFLNA